MLAELAVSERGKLVSQRDQLLTIQTARQFSMSELQTMIDDLTAQIAKYDAEFKTLSKAIRDQIGALSV